ncbi:MAG: ATP-binding protein [Clostridia bacterium]|nr:ATP-binding protein [Clostridia bacterium]
MERSQIISKLKYAYALKQKKAEFFAEQTKERALEDKEYLTLEIKERTLVLDISKLNFEKKPTEQLEKELTLVKEQKKLVLTRLNIAEEALTAHYECEICHDTGKINGDYCTCFKHALNNVLMHDSHINLDALPSLKDYSLEIFAEVQKNQILKVLDICKKFTRAFPASKTKTLIFSGASGVGKTYLSKIIAKEIIEKGYTAFYTTAFNLNNIMLKYHTTFDDNKQELLTHLIDSDLLVIDDLGTEPILKNVTLEYLLLIINERLEKNKSTIINTNLGPTHILDRYKERVFSRLMNKRNSYLISIDGLDLRLKKTI